MIPDALAYPNEKAFTDECVIPLLNRLGFGLVENYHGTREFGKDLICGVFDNFGDPAFYGIQVKYVASISVNAVEDLVRDCKQAFYNSFQHPRTGAKHQIARFMAINAGSISDQARQHFFNSVDYPLRPNSRLIDGQTLLSLQKYVGWQEVQRIREQIVGMIAEVKENRKLISVGGLADFARRYGEEKTVPLERLRNNCVAVYLASPSLPSVIAPWQAHMYWQATQSMNKFLSNRNRNVLTLNAIELSAKGDSWLDDKVSSV